VIYGPNREGTCAATWPARRLLVTPSIKPLLQTNGSVAPAKCCFVAFRILALHDSTQGDAGDYEGWMYCRPVERALCVGCFVFCRPDSSKRMEVFALLCSTSEGTGRRDDGEMHTGYMCIFM